MRLKETLPEYFFLNYRTNILLEQNSSIFNQVEVFKSRHNTNMLFLQIFVFHKDSFATNKYPKEKKVYCTDLQRYFSPMKNTGKKHLEPEYLKYGLKSGLNFKTAAASDL